MWSFLNESFSMTGQFPHGYCLQWNSALLWTLVISDTLIAISYFSIPFAVFYFANKRPDVPHRWLFLLFGVFIVACGITHLLDVLTIWQPKYWTNAIAKALTAIFSLVTAIVIWRIMPSALLAPSTQELESAKSQLEKANAELEFRVTERTVALANTNATLKSALETHKALHQAINREKALLRVVIDSIPDLIFFKNPDSIYLGCNKAYEAYIGAAESDIIGKSDFDLVAADLAKSFQQHDQEVLTAEEARINEHWVTYPNGKRVCLETLKAPFRNMQGTILGMIGVSRDISERREAELKLQLAANVFTHAREGIMITAADGSILEINDTFTHITGYNREEILGQNPKFLHSGRQESGFYAEMWKSVLEKGYWCGEIWNRRKNGQVYAEILTISAVLDATGKTLNYVGLFSDITPMKEHQQQLEQIAHFDPITSLPNRVLLADRLKHAMSRSQRHNQLLAVVYLDLDGFKAVNDTHGHDIGDELLVVIAQRMKESLRDSDTLARIGGDEFVAVLADFENVTDCEPILARLLTAAANPVLFSHLVLQVSASIGVTFYPKDGADADQLMRHADQAMYIAKQAGKNRYHIFDVDQDMAIQSQHERLEFLQQALDQRQFVLHYHPKVNLKSGEVIGVEALIRWQHPERGLLPPADFLPILQNHPLAIRIGQWVIDTVLTQIGDWRASGLDMPVSVNIDAQQLQQHDFFHQLAAILGKHPDINPNYLELEILETSLLDDMMAGSTNIQACREIGIRFALDDFGTGYSSLTYLRRLPADTLKIDQSFIRDMLDDPDDLAIVSGVIGLAKVFSRQVIAEGVESIDHGLKLLSLDCELAQGFGIARPMPGADLPAWVDIWLKQNNCLHGLNEPAS